MSYYPEPHRSNSHSNSSNTYPPYAQGKAQGWYDDQTLTSTPTYKSTPSTLGYSKEDRDDYRVDLGRAGLRTPSPTPSELKEMKTGAIDWKLISTWRFWLRREWLWYYVALVIITTITALVTIYHKEIVHWLTPVTRWLFDLKFGWLVPIAVLFVISFPPLFGHEIVAILCGLVWGLWVGFGIVAAGTFLGEVGNFYAFKYCCRARGEKLERTKISYACLAKVVRDGGFKIALVARLSAIPGHFTTAVFSTCGMGIFVFSLAAILSMPKQLITVYLGVILEEAGNRKPGEKADKTSKIISNVVLALTVLVTVIAMWYMLREMNRVKPQIIYERRKARQGKLAALGSDAFSASRLSVQGASTTSLRTPGSETTLPLKSDLPSPQYPFAKEYQRSSLTSPTSPYSPGVHAPQPQKMFSTGFNSAHNRGHANHDPQQSVDVGWEMGPYGARQTLSPPPARFKSPEQEQHRSYSPQHQHQHQSQPLSPPRRQHSEHLQINHAPQPQQYQNPPVLYPGQHQQFRSYEGEVVEGDYQGLTPPTSPLPPQQQRQQGTPVLAPGRMTELERAPSPNEYAAYGQHQAEPTMMSYHTAIGSSHSYGREPSDGSDVGFVPGGYGR